MKETFEYFQTNKPRERAAIITLVRSPQSRPETEDHLDELERLADTAGADVLVRLTQERPLPDVALYLGKGKVEELRKHVEMLELQLVLFDDDLSPVQVRNLEQELKVKVLDRTGLILDIFASRARTREAKTQIELAQLEYYLPRLTRQWTHLSKQYGGIGTKGPGETQIETDRRLIKTRISKLKEKLVQIARQHETRREGRSDELARVALVGYTNAGKSSLLNTLSSAGVFVEDRLFATLDATTRSVDVPEDRKILLTDTVGFIRKLPAKLVASFRTTLSEVVGADILLHVVDASSLDLEEHIAVVNETIQELGASDKPVILVFNKTDLVDKEDRERLNEIAARFPHHVFVSAERGYGIPTLRHEISVLLNEASSEMEVEVPMDHYEIASRLHELAEVKERRYTDRSVLLKLLVHRRNVSRVERLLARAA
ncbi:MAG: GTPase HflX [Bacteroidetes bacterium]|nr:GTPase HflX [Bacteroidota bacterium]